MTENERRLGLALDKALRELADARKTITILRELLRENASKRYTRVPDGHDPDDEIPF